MNRQVCKGIMLIIQISLRRNLEVEIKQRYVILPGWNKHSYISRTLDLTEQCDNNIAIKVWDIDTFTYSNPCPDNVNNDNNPVQNVDDSGMED